MKTQIAKHRLLRNLRKSHIKKIKALYPDEDHEALEALGVSELDKIIRLSKVLNAH